MKTPADTTSLIYTIRDKIEEREHNGYRIMDVFEDILTVLDTEQANRQQLYTDLSDLEDRITNIETSIHSLVAQVGSLQLDVAGYASKTHTHHQDDIINLVPDLALAKESGGILTHQQRDEMAKAIKDIEDLQLKAVLLEGKVNSLGKKEKETMGT